MVTKGTRCVLLHPAWLLPSSRKSFRMMAGTTGLEPATSAVTGQRSNQLSYVPKIASQQLGICHIESSVSQLSPSFALFYRFAAADSSGDFSTQHVIATTCLSLPERGEFCCPSLPSKNRKYDSWARRPSGHGPRLFFSLPQEPHATNEHGSHCSDRS